MVSYAYLISRSSFFVPSLALHAISRRCKTWLASETPYGNAPLTTEAVARDLGAGTISALVNLSFMLGYAAMIFGGDLQKFLPVGMPVLLMSSFLVGAILAWRSSLPFTIAGPDANLTAILAVAVSGIAASVRAAGGSDETILFTAILTLTMMSLVVGAVALGTGLLGRGTLVQLVPHSVITGFLAGTGFLIVSGSFQIVTGSRLNLSVIDVIGQTHPLAIGTAAAILALLLGLKRLREHPLGMPALLVVGVAGFHAFAAAIGLSPARLAELGMVPGRIALDALTPMPAIPFGLIVWPVIAAHMPELASAVLIALLTVVLNNSGLEIATGRDIDMNKELRETGWANLASGLLGGTVGYVAMSRTTLNFRLGARSRLAGLWAVAFGLTLVVVFPSAVALIPKPVLGGLLMYLGVAILLEQAVRSRHRLPLHEYLLVLAILGVIATYGFLAGIGLGLIAACVLFAWNYGRVSCIDSTFTGASQRSRMHRTIGETRILDEKGDLLFGLRLQGYVFFGTARSIVGHVAEALEAAQRGFVVIDMREVQGIDASALVTLQKLKRICAETKLIFSGLSDEMRALLERGNVLAKDSLAFPDLDHAVEWVENRILDEGGAARTQTNLRKTLARHFRPENLERLLFMLQPADLAAGQTIFRRGEKGDALLFIESGQLGVRSTRNAVGVRLASYGPGTMVGEASLFTAEPHAANVVADAPSKVLRLTADKLRELERTSAAAALELKTLVIQSLAARLGAANREIDALGG